MPRAGINNLELHVQSMDDRYQAAMEQLRREFPAGEVVNVEEDDLGGDSDSEPRDIEVADTLYTQPWTEIETDDDARAFVSGLLEHATESEREYISNIYHGRSNTVVALQVIADSEDDHASEGKT